MSSDDTLLRAPVGVAYNKEDLVSVPPDKVQAEFVYVHTKPEDDGTISDTNIHSSGMEIDHINIAFEERNVSVTVSDQISSEITEIVPSRYALNCGLSGSDSSDREESDSFKGQSTKVRKFSQGASLVPKESWRTRIASTRLKSTKNYISYHNITYSVPQGWFFQNKPLKRILNSISGIMRVGVNAIIGPSGSGKSSLLDVLADRKDRSRVSGHVLINGEKQPHNFKCASGYVVQDDVLSGTLTIKENVYLSATLRLPGDMDRQEKEEKVDEIIKELDLSHVADTLIGTPFIRGVSGGQKKRCSIAMELVVSPGILFLDEPTTGLDSTTAESVIQLLHNLSKDGRVIVMSIHQPRYSIFRLCDHITLLSRGNIVYTGAGRATLPYFAEVLGLECDTFDNPPDFFLDKMNEAETEDLESSSPETGDTGNALANKWLASENYRLLNVELDQLLEKTFEQPVVVATKYATNPLIQSYYLFDRAMRILLRDPSVGASVLMLNLILGVFSGIMFFQLEDDGPNVFFDRSGALFFCMICNMFAVNAGMEVLIGERALFIHENSSGYYCVSSYYLSKLFGDLIPLRMVPISIFSLIAYWMIGFQKSVGKFFLFMLGLLAQNITMSGLVYSIAAGVGVLSAGQILMNVIVVFCLVFTGFFVRLGSIPFWLSWLQWLCPFKYSFALMLNLILGFFSGIIFFQLEDDGPNVISDRAGALFFCLICNLFSVSSGLELFISERPLFIHENSSGYYRVSAYYLSKLFGDLIPLRLLPVPVFVIIAYWMIGFQTDVGKFFLFLLGVVSQNLTMSGIVYTMGAGIGVLASAQILMNVFVIFAMVFGGFFISLDSVPVWLSWLQWLSPFKYSFTILAENELEDTVFCVTFDGGNCTDVELGNDFLRQLDFLEYNIWLNFLGLGLIALATLILAYVFLVRIKKTT